MICPSCNTLTPDDARFCLNCGTKLPERAPDPVAVSTPAVCPVCNMPVQPGSKFCSNCGARLETSIPFLSPDGSIVIVPSEPIAISPLQDGAGESTAGQTQLQEPAYSGAYERRLVTILFADVTSYSTLSERLDPEEVMEIMRGAYPCLLDPIALQGGTVVQVMGDGVLAFFGAPVGHEDDPERAIRAGLEIQRCIQGYAARLLDERQIASFKVRVGIHSGLVVVGEMSPDRHLEYTALGDAVNLAARLQQIAPPGGVLVSHEVYRHVRLLFNAQAQEPVTVKGRQQPVQTYLVSSIKPHAWRIRTRGVEGVETRMIGREPEMLALQNLFEDALHSSEISLALITGEAGLGKSRLADEFVAWVDLLPQDVWYFRGRASPGSLAAPYSIFHDLFTFRFEIRESDSAAQALQAFRHGMAAYLEPDQSDLVGQLVGFDFSASPAVARLLGSASFAQLATLYLLNFFRQLAAEPILIVLEDLHWADDSSLDLIVQLVTEVGGNDAARLMLVCAARPSLFERRPNWGEGIPGVHRLALRPLSKRSSHRLVEEILKKAEHIPEPLIERIVDETEGSPLFIEELIKMLIDDGVIDTGRDPWRINPERLEDLHVPPTLVGILQARLDGLPHAERQVLQRAAVVGRVFWDRLVSALTDDPAEAQQIGALLGSLREREMIYRRERSAIAGVEEYIFKHSLLQETAYETVLLKQRRRYHNLVAAWIEANAVERLEEYLPLIASHYAQGDQPITAAERYTRAGQRALALGALIEARRSFTLALDLLPPSDQARRWSALVGRDEVVGLLGDVPARQADDAALMALAIETQNDSCLAEAYLRVAHQAHYEGDHTRAQESYNLALQAARRAGDTRLEATILPLQIFDLVRQGELDAARPLIEPALQIAYNSGNENVLARALTNVSIYYISNGDLAQAAKLTLQVVDINQGQGNRIGEVIGLTNLGYYYLALGLFEAGRDVLEKASLAARELESRQATVYSLLNLGLAYWRLKQFQAARHALETSLLELHDLGYQMALASYYFYLGLVQEETGELDEADDSYQQAHDLFNQLGAAPLAAETHAGIARVYLLKGELNQAFQAACDTWDYLTENGPQGLELPILAYLSCADVFQASNERARLDQVLEAGRQELEERAERISDPDWRTTFFEAVPEHHRLLNFARD